jgi:hypothetical protein
MMAAYGFTDEKGYRKVAVNWPPEVFVKINARADAAKVSFSTMAVRLAHCGIMDYEDSERLEPKRKRRRAI